MGANVTGLETVQVGKVGGIRERISNGMRFMGTKVNLRRKSVYRPLFETEIAMISRDVRPGVHCALYWLLVESEGELQMGQALPG